MKKIFLLVVTFCVFFNILFGLKASADNLEYYQNTMKQDILSVMMAYPEYVTGVEKGTNDKVYLLMRSGRKILYDDQRTKSFEQKMAAPDIQDMMEQRYPLNSIKDLMDKNFDPGRMRVYSLLGEVYGSSKSQVTKNLKNVNVGSGYYQFNRNNRAADSLKSAMSELIPLSRKSRKVAAFMYPGNGTFNYRCISGTSQLSSHAYGIAIDLARDKKDYWKWATKEEGKKRLQSYPQEIVDIFEKNNFVWGGKWSHFDILHFEYRPEIIIKARYCSNNQDEVKVWYGNFPYSEDFVKRFIEKIDLALN